MAEGLAHVLSGISFSVEDAFTVSVLSQRRTYKGMRPVKLLLCSVMACAAAIALAGSCAAQDASASPQQSAFARATCQSVMHVRTNAELWGCVQSLSDTIAQNAQTARGWASDESCAAEGLKRDTPEFAVCVLQSHGSAQGAYGAVPTHIVTGSYPEQRDWLGYYSGTFDAVRRREQYACAQLGLDPNFGRFSECVDSLDGAMHAADSPPMG